MSQRETNGASSRRPSSAPGSGTRLDPEGDEVLAAVLIRMWTLASGRTLRRDVPPDQLSVDELIAFWADDLTPPSGRHAKPGLARHRAPRGPAPDRTGRPVSRSRARSRREPDGRAQGARPRTA
jgi:hypothetical protein